MATASIYEHLKADNHRILKLLDLLEQTAITEPAARRQLLERIRRAILAHNRAEERNLYALLLHQDVARSARSDVLGARHAVVQSQRQNGEVQEMLDLLDVTRADDEGFEPLVRTLHARMQEHVRHEEHSLFETAQQVLPEEQAEIVGRTLIREHERFRDQLRAAGGP